MCPVDLPPRYSPSSRLVGGRPLVSASSRMASRMRARIVSPVRLIPQPFKALERLSHMVPGLCKLVKVSAPAGRFRLGLMLQRRASGIRHKRTGRLAEANQPVQHEGMQHERIAWVTRRHRDWMEEPDYRLYRTSPDSSI